MSHADNLRGKLTSIGEGKGIISKPLFLGQVIDFLKRWIFKPLLGIIILVVIAAIIVLLYFVITRVLIGTGAGTVIAQHGESVIEQNVPVWVAKIGLTNVYLAIAKPETLFTPSFVSEVEKSQNKEIGAKIKSFKPIIETVFETDPIEFNGEIEVATLDRPMKVLVFCQLEEYKGGPYPEDLSMIPAQLIGINSNGNEAVIYENDFRTFEAGCLFPPGSVPVPKTRTITAQKAKLIVVFEGYGVASSPIYLFPEERKRALALDGREPFEYYKINEQGLQSDNRIKSRTTPGPLNLGIGIFQSQPIGVGVPYSLGVTVAHNYQWRGNLNKIEELSIKIPSTSDLDITLSSEQEFGNTLGEASTCAFDPIGKTPDEFQIYTLRGDLLKRVNKDCNTQTLKSSTLTKQKCIDIFKEKINYKCKFVVKNMPLSERPVKDFIGVEAKYLFQSESGSVINVLRIPEEEGGVTTPFN